MKFLPKIVWAQFSCSACLMDYEFGAKYRRLHKTLTKIHKTPNISGSNFKFSSSLSMKIFYES